MFAVKILLVIQETDMQNKIQIAELTNARKSKKCTNDVVLSYQVLNCFNALQDY